MAEGFSQLLLGGQKNEPTDNNGTLLLSWLAGTPQNSVRPFREAFSHSLAALENELSPRWLTPATQSQKTLLEPT
ncbi:MAG: hypothetical protein LRY76_01760 [Alphaproteobacteria bacterium]|nr:hypothetical protein [Alphaproteobacteria bacterium]